jgi:hypothetical protein
MLKRRPVLYSLIPVYRGPSREQPSEPSGFRFRPVADAFGAPVVRDQGSVIERTAGYLSVWLSIARGAARSFGRKVLGSQPFGDGNGGMLDQ